MGYHFWGRFLRNLSDLLRTGDRGLGVEQNGANRTFIESRAIASQRLRQRFGTRSTVAIALHWCKGGQSAVNEKPESVWRPRRWTANTIKLDFARVSDCNDD